MGGFYGSIPHFLQSDLTDSDKRQALYELACGNTPFCQKFDGVNLYFGFNLERGRVILARNRHQVQQNEIFLEETLDEIRSRGIFPASIVHFIEKKINTLPGATIRQIFGSPEDRKYYNCELVGPDYENIIPYRENLLKVLPLGHKKLTSGDIVERTRGQENDLFRLEHALELKENNFIDFVKMSPWLPGDELSRRSAFFDTLGGGLHDLEAFILGSVPLDARDWSKDYKIAKIKEKAPPNVRVFPVEGVIFDYSGIFYKLVGDFSQINRHWHATRPDQTNTTVALFPGSFRPPHAGHYDLVRRLLTQVDKVLVLVSPVSRGDIPSSTSEAIWKLFLGNNPRVQVRVTPAGPVQYILNSIDEFRRYPGSVMVVQSGKDEGRFSFLIEKFKGTGVKVEELPVNLPINSTQLRTAVEHDDKESLFEGLPAHLSLLIKEKVWNLLKQRDLDFMPIYTG